MVDAQGALALFDHPDPLAGHSEADRKSDWIQRGDDAVARRVDPPEPAWRRKPDRSEAGVERDRLERERDLGMDGER